MTDLARVMKVYKLVAPKTGKKGQVVADVHDIDSGSAETRRKEMEVAILGAIALRGAS